MQKTVNVQLDEDVAKFVDSQVAEGKYSTAAEALSASKRQEMEYEIKVKALNDAIEEGENSGDPEPFDFDEFIEEMEREGA